jgi:recombinational DNA repair ATPase RecF
LEDFYRAKLKANRQNDLENFKTEFGIHRADFDAIFCDKNISATKSSTGEQKAIMISNSKEYYQYIVHKLKSNKVILSDAKSYTQNLESAYQKSLENYANNLPYENIYIN